MQLRNALITVALPYLQEIFVDCLLNIGQGPQIKMESMKVLGLSDAQADLKSDQ